jgi:uncharacterized protein (TIGR02466 family)
MNTDMTTQTAVPPPPASQSAPAVPAGAQAPAPGAAEGLAAAVRRHMISPFANPVLVYPWPDSERLNAELKALILETERRQPGMVRSNVGGWHSDLGVFGWDAPCIRELQERVRLASIEMTKGAITKPNVRFRANYRLDGWANVVRPGDYHIAHNHPGNVWSGVYYVAIGEAEAGRPYNGQLELLDPRAGPNMLGPPEGLFDLRYTINTQPGLMVIFPSWLRHYVHPFFGSGERISVAFNVAIGNFRYLDAKET